MNIFVANLNYNLKKEVLQELFEQFGTVTQARIVTDRETGRSKGFGFVEMEDDNEALKAIEQLDGSELSGRNIVVKKAEPKR